MQKCDICAAGKDVIAPDHQYILAIQIAPVGHVLVVVLVHVHKRIFRGCAKIMRHGTRRLSLHHYRMAFMRRLPDPQIFLRIAFRHCVRIFAHHLLLDLGPEADQRKRAIEANIQRAVIDIVKAFQVTERVFVLG